LLHKQNENVLRNLLNDNQILNEKLNQALDLLKNIKSTDFQVAETPSTKLKKSLNNFQAANLLINSIKQLENTNSCHFETQPATNTNSYSQSSQSKTKRAITENELIATQMLEQYDWVRLAIGGVNNNHHLNSLSKSQSARASNCSTQNIEENSPHSIDTFDKLELLINRIKLNRNTIHSRLFQATDMAGDFDLLLNVCNHCSGQIQNI
jgi:hypothetical protein